MEDKSERKKSLDQSCYNQPWEQLKEPPSLSKVLSAYGLTYQSPIHQIWAEITVHTTNLHHFNKLKEYDNYSIKMHSK